VVADADRDRIVTGRHQTLTATRAACPRPASRPWWAARGAPSATGPWRATTSRG